MSDNRRDITQGNHEAYNAMSTSELEDIIMTSFFDVNIEYNHMREMLDVYAKRDGVPTGDSNAAWETFLRDYAGKGEMYPTDDPTNDADNSTQTAHNKIRSKRINSRRFVSLRRFGVAAAIFIVFSTVFFSTTVQGLSFWQPIAQWGREVLGFSDRAAPLPINDELVSLHDALAEHGITTRLAPSWIPDGFILIDMSVVELPSQVLFTSQFEKYSELLIIQITLKDYFANSLFEKSDGDVSIYNRNGIEHFVFQNEGITTVVWSVNNYECVIFGDITIFEAKQIIDSIYER
ncbi:MAG: DUF4367 domain-containing protein [Oscillospiraceae bacterium]|nr:DUF4367 domain-containing protein [Oscillospiraceae bacterium]